MFQPQKVVLIPVSQVYTGQTPDRRGAYYGLFPAHRYHLHLNRSRCTSVQGGIYALGKSRMRSKMIRVKERDSTVGRASGGREPPGAVLKRVRVPGATREFFPRAGFQCRFSHSVCTTIVLSVKSWGLHGSVNIRSHIKNPKDWQPYYYLDIRFEIAAHIDRNG